MYLLVTLDTEWMPFDIDVLVWQLIACQLSRYYSWPLLLTKGYMCHLFCSPTHCMPLFIILYLSPFVFVIIFLYVSPSLCLFVFLFDYLILYIFSSSLANSPHLLSFFVSLCFYLFLSIFFVLYKIMVFYHKDC